MAAPLGPLHGTPVKNHCSISLSNPVEQVSLLPLPIYNIYIFIVTNFNLIFSFNNILQTSRIILMNCIIPLCRRHENSLNPIFLFRPNFLFFGRRRKKGRKKYPNVPLIDFFNSLSRSDVLFIFSTSPSPPPPPSPSSSSRRRTSNRAASNQGT